MTNDQFVINLTGSGDSTIIAAPTITGQFIRVMHYHFSSDRPTTVTIKGGSETVDICYATNASGGGIATPEYTGGIFDLPVNTALVLNNSAVANVGGAGKYVIKGPVSNPNTLLAPGA